VKKTLKPSALMLTRPCRCASSVPNRADGCHESVILLS
jgi:hypothetical protein